MLRTSGHALELFPCASLSVRDKPRHEAEWSSFRAEFGVLRAGQSVEWSPRRCSGRKRTRLALSGRGYDSTRWSGQLPRATLEDQPPRSSSVASTPNESLVAVRTCGEVDERRADTVHDDGDGRHHQGGPFDVKIVVPSRPHLRRHVSSSVGAHLQPGLRRRASQTQQGNIFEPLLQDTWRRLKHKK